MEYVTLGNYCSITSSKRIFAEQYVEKGVPFYRSKEIIEKNNGQEISEPLYIEPEVYETIKKKFGVPQKGDLLLTSVGTVGIPYIVKDEQFYFKDGNLTWMRNFSKELSSKYLYYWISSKFGKDSLVNRCIGSSQAALTIDILKNYKLFIPKRDIQDKVVSILSAYDNLIENNNKRIKILEQMAENLYKEWFARFRFPGHETTSLENGIPRGWSEKRLSDLIDVDPLLPVKKGIQVKSIPMEALSTDSMIVDENCIQLVDNPSGSHSQNGDTLVARITPCLENGKTGFVQCLDDGETATGSTEFIVLRSKELSPYYVYCFARSQYFRQTAILSMNGADGRQRVNVPKIKSMKIAKPSNEIIKRFDSIAKPIFEEIYLLTKQNKNNIKQRDLLLPRLMNGKLAV